MPAIINTIADQQDSGSTTYTQAIPRGHQSGDLLVAFVHNGSSGGSAMTATGWTSIGATTTVGSHRYQVFYKFASSSSEPPISVTGQNAHFNCIITVIRGADATTPINQITNADATSTSSSLTSGTVTTTSDNCLILQAFLSDATGKMMVDNPNTLVNLDKVSHNTTNGTIILGYRNKATAGTTTAITALFEQANVRARSFTVAIADANPSSPTMSPDSRNVFDIVKYHMGISATQSPASSNFSLSRHESTTWNDATYMAPTTIGGITVANNAPSIGNAQNSDAPWGTMTALQIGGSAIDATGRWVGGAHDVTLDLTGKLLALTFGMNDVATNLFGSQGCLVVLQDGSNNWVAYQLSARAGMGTGRAYTAIIAPTEATPYDSSGSINFAAITKIGYFYHKVSTSASVRQLYIKHLVTLSNTIMYGGSSTAPINPAFVDRVLHGWGMVGYAQFQGNGQIIVRHNVQYGNGSDKSYIDFSTTSTELERTPNGTFNRQFWQGGDELITINYNTSSDDTVRLNRSIQTTNIKQYLDFSDGSTPTSFSSIGSTISGFNVIGKANITFERTTFDSCYGIDLNGASLLNSSVTNSVTSPAVTTDDPSNIKDTAFTSAGTGHAIKATATGTFAFEGNTFSGYGADGTDDAAFFNDSGGLITLEIPAGGQTPTIKNGSGASTVIDTPTANQSVTISGAVAGSRIEIYDLTSDTQLYNGTPTFPYTWTDPNPYENDREIRLRVAYTDGTTAKRFIEANIGTSTADTPALAYLVNQVDDTVYNINGIDGSTVDNVAIDDSVLMAQIDTGSLSWGALYAYECYWLTTEEGIEDKGQMIFAVDPANYLFDDLVVTNVTSPEVPLIMTGGYARNLTTGATIDVFDTGGGRIFNAPDHVVAYATGSGVTPEDISNIRSGLALEANATANKAEVLDAIDDLEGGGAGVTPEDIAEIRDGLALQATSEEILSNTDATQAKVDQL